MAQAMVDNGVDAAIAAAVEVSQDSVLEDVQDDGASERTRRWAWRVTLPPPPEGEDMPDYTDLVAAAFNVYQAKYCRYQLERGQDGSYHYQGVVQFATNARKAKLLKFTKAIQPHSDQSKTYSAPLKTDRDWLRMKRYVWKQQHNLPEGVKLVQLELGEEGKNGVGKHQMQTLMESINEYGETEAEKRFLETGEHLHASAPSP